MVRHTVSRRFLMQVLLSGSITFLMGCAAKVDRGKAKEMTADDGNEVTVVKGKVVKGKVLFNQDAELGDVEASDADVEAIINSIKQLWNSYLHMDFKGFRALLAPDITRLSQRTRLAQQGIKAVLEGMKAEWEAFERPNNLIAEVMTLRSMEISVDDKEQASLAVVLYWVEVEGGARWHYDDQGVVLQVFAKQADRWRLVHQTDGWSIDYNLDADEPGETPAFVFDYVYPVSDLDRAVKFYSPLLGKPDAITQNRAFFGLRGPKFILDATQLQGHAKVRKNLPNGYAVIYVADIAQEKIRLLKQNATFLANSDRQFVDIGGDQGILIQDNAGNVIAIAERGSEQSEVVDRPPSITGLRDRNPYIKAARKIAWAWLTKDTKTITQYHGEDGQWLDDTRTSIRGLESGSQALAQALEEIYWPYYESGRAGLSIKMVASQVQVRQLKGYTLVSYVRSFEGKGHHPFRETAFVTHLFADEDTILYTLIISATRSNGLAIELDYTGHPVDNLNKAELFYTRTMAFGEPYHDDNWRGWWSNNTVYGAYTADPEHDKIPQKGLTNGYVSFWVQSAQQTYDYLKSSHVNFPVITSINQKKGLDTNPGYTQCVATDSEGNLVVFTEYSGKKR